MASKSNRKAGTDFERELCATLADRDYWCHRLAQNSAGQPFDVLAAKNGRCYPIDCKVCENDTFNLSRIESNQFWAMDLWTRCGNGECWFALQLSDGLVYMLPFSTAIELSKTRTVLNRRIIEHCCPTLEDWL